MATKIEKILLSKMDFRDCRGRSAKYQKDMFLREFRNKNKSTILFAITVIYTYIDGTIYIKEYTAKSWRNAEFIAYQTKNRIECEKMIFGYDREYLITSFSIYHTETGINVTNRNFLNNIYREYIKSKTTQ